MQDSVWVFSPVADHKLPTWTEEYRVFFLIFCPGTKTEKHAYPMTALRIYVDVHIWMQVVICLTVSFCILSSCGNYILVSENLADLIVVQLCFALDVEFTSADSMVRLAKGNGSFQPQEHLLKTFTWEWTVFVSLSHMAQVFEITELDGLLHQSKHIRWFLKPAVFEPKSLSYVVIQIVKAEVENNNKT